MVLLVFILMGCQQGQAIEEKEITIFAASSLTESVTEICSTYEQTHGAVTSKLHFAGSKTLRSQIENGAPADIFISANEKHYKALVESDDLIEGGKLLTNEMVLIVSLDAAKHINGLEDLTINHQLILADHGVPAGDYARQVISKLSELYGNEYEENVLQNLASSESNVRQVLTKVVLGEGDAALVYKTDVTKDIEDKLVLIEIPEAYNVVASYWIGFISNETISKEVEAYGAFFSDEKSHEIFKSYGFGIAE